MSYAHKLKYAGGDPHEPEQERDDISHAEMELLKQDETYQKLTELRYLAEAAESDLASDELVEQSNADRALFDAIGVRDAPLQQAVDRYVAQWLAEHRADSEDVAADEEVSADA
jgi:predicted restriction endonuclease